MKNKTKIFFVSAALALAGLFAVSTVSAQGLSEADQRANCANFYSMFKVKSLNTVGFLPNKFCTITDVVQYVISGMLTLAGSAAVIFIILGGFWLLTSAGNEEQAEKGRKVLTNSVIGLIAIIMAFAMVRIVVNLITGNPGDVSGTGTASSGATQSSNSSSAASGVSLPANTPKQISYLATPPEPDPLQSVSIKVSVPKSSVTCDPSGDIFYAAVAEPNGPETANSQPTDVQQTSDTYEVTFTLGTPYSYGYNATGQETSRDAVQMPFDIYVCGTQAYSSKINVVKSLNAQQQAISPRGSSSAELAAALKDSNFSIIADSASKKFTIYAFAGTSNDLTVLCTDPTEAGVRATAKSLKGGADYVMTQPTNIFSSAGAGRSAAVSSGISSSDYDQNSVRVFICGNEVSKQ